MKEPYRDLPQETCAPTTSREADQPTQQSCRDEDDRTSLSKTMRAAETFALAARSSTTIRAYSSDWKDFADWCAENYLPALPAEGSSVALYITALAERGRKVATISRRLVSIASIHRKEGYESP